jgi:hypothetical protein
MMSGESSCLSEQHVRLAGLVEKFESGQTVWPNLLRAGALPSVLAGFGGAASLLRCLREEAFDSLTVQATAGMAVVTRLRGSASDVDIALRALQFGLAPAPLSPWYMQSPQPRGLLLGVTNLNARRLAADCRRLAELAR